MAVDRRKKDAAWNILDENGNVPHVNFNAAQLAVLMDLRDRLDAVPLMLIELKKLNELLHAPGFNNAWLAAYIAASRHSAVGPDTPSDVSDQGQP